MTRTFGRLTMGGWLSIAIALILLGKFQRPQTKYNGQTLVFGIAFGLFFWISGYYWPYFRIF